jgi:clan AA aspartic protease
MIEGRVNTEREAVVRVPVWDEGEADRRRTVRAVVDTGYDGFLTLPPSLTQELDLASYGQGEALLADGSVQDVPLYLAVVQWDGEACPVVVEEVDAAPLLGMLLLEDYDLRIACREGGRVRIYSLSV